MKQTIHQIVSWFALVVSALMLLGAACVVALASIALGTLQDWLARRAPPRGGVHNPNCMQDGDDIWT